jgi:hypothetical protein
VPADAYAYLDLRARASPALDAGDDAPAAASLPPQRDLGVCLAGAGARTFSPRPPHPPHPPSARSARLARNAARQPEAYLGEGAARWMPPPGDAATQSGTGRDVGPPAGEAGAALALCEGTAEPPPGPGARATLVVWPGPLPGDSAKGAAGGGDHDGGGGGAWRRQDDARRRGDGGVCGGQERGDVQSPSLETLMELQVRTCLVAVAEQVARSSG